MLNVDLSILDKPKLMVNIDRARNLMKQLDWKLLLVVDNDTLEVEFAVLYHPLQANAYRLRRNSAKKLLSECRVIGAVTDEITVLCYDHDGSNEKTI